MLAITLLGTVGSEVGSMVSDRLIGRRKCTPYISPRKTWEGVVCSYISTLMVIWVLRIVSKQLILPDFDKISIILLSAIISIFSFLGDIGM